MIKTDSLTRRRSNISNLQNLIKAKQNAVPAKLLYSIFGTGIVPIKTKQLTKLIRTGRFEDAEPMRIEDEYLRTDRFKDYEPNQTVMQGNELLKHFHIVEQHNNIFKSNIFKLRCCNLRFFQSIQHKFQGIEFMNNAPTLNPSENDEHELALRVVGDKIALYGCGFYGNQDTLLDQQGRRFYKECFIERFIDFIYANARSLVISCNEEKRDIEVLGQLKLLKPVNQDLTWPLNMYKQTNQLEFLFDFLDYHNKCC
ncbi:hypothetical protein YC2023_049258 [Brassica napus]